jgi:hypothetical protein
MLMAAMGLMTNRVSVDQPYLSARGVTGWFDPGKERLFIGMDDFTSIPTSSTLEHTLDAAAGMPAFTTTHIDAGAPTPKDNYQTRPIVAADGHVYAAFYRRLTSVMNVGYTADVVVVRDDNWGQGMPPYTNLIDAGSMPPLSGQRAAPGVTVTDDCFCDGTGNGSPSVFPNQRQGGDLFITVDPTDARVLYLSWADRQPGDPMTLHLRRSIDSGQSWPGPDLLTVPSAKNAGIAVNSQGRLAFLYQQWAGVSPNHRWQTHLRRFVGGVWTDDTLSDMPCEAACGWTGDYEYLAAAGKNFFGVYSASNDPTTLPAGTTFLRNHSGAMPPVLWKIDNTPVGNSIDPFFFRTTELSTDDDFYVRDWTDNGSTYDHGLEPSSHLDFFHTSDVWNQRTNDPLPFDGNDRPQSHDPQPMMMGPNFAFLRISRETGGPAADVAVEFFFSDGGVGVPYVSAGTTSVHFDAGQTQKTIPAGGGVSWNLPSGMSNHVCLAAQIHTANDPFIPPGLLNHAPGWPSGTDLEILNDNNKAQRNMQVFGYGGMGGGMSMYAIVHNDARETRDMTIGFAIDRRLAKVLGKPHVIILDPYQPTTQDLRRRSTVTLLRMQPGEDRWVAVQGEAKGTATGSIRMYEVVKGRVLNGYAFVPRKMKGKDVARQNTFQHAAVFARAAELFHDAQAADVSRAAQKLIDRPEDYSDLLNHDMPELERLSDELIARSGGIDPIGVKKAYKALASAGDAGARAAAHLSLLNALDALETMIQRRK